MAELDAAHRAAIQQEAHSSINRIAALFGIANLAVILAAIWSFWTYAQGQVSAISEDVKTSVFAELTTTRDELRTAVNDANQLIGRLQERAEDLDALDVRLEDVKDRLDLLEDENLVAGASGFLTAWDGSQDVDQLMRNLDLKVATGSGLDCQSPRVFSGIAPPGKLSWKAYNGNPKDAFVTIDTGAAGFTKPPLYFASIEGSGAWSAQGVNAIYARKAQSFDVYVKWSPSSGSNIVSYASDRWSIHWLAVGC